MYFRRSLSVTVWLALCVGGGSVFLACGGGSDDSDGSDAGSDAAEQTDASGTTGSDAGGDAKGSDAADADGDGDGDGGDAGDADAAPSTPKSVDDSYTTNEDIVLSVAAPGLLANDVGTSVVAGTKSTAQGGSVTITADGAFEYQPAADFYGMDSFDYELDGVANSLATVTIDVASVNDAPTISAVSNILLNQPPDQLISNAAWVSWTAGPANESTQKVSFVLTPKGTTPLAFKVAPMVNAATGALEFQVEQNKFGDARYTLEVTDDGGTDRGGKNLVTTDFTISVNTPPSPGDESISANSGLSCVVVEPLLNDTDADGDAFTYRITDVPDSGKLYIFDATKADNFGPQVTFRELMTAPKLCYKPNSRFFVGVDKAKYELVDARGGVSVTEGVMTFTIIEN